MALTGNRRTLTLRLRNLTTDTLTGQTKPNLPGDPDYVPDVYDPVLCLVTTTLVCPVVKAAGVGADKIFYEFSLPSSVIANPAFAKLEVILRASDTSIQDIHTYTDFSPNYFSAQFEGVPSDTYTIDLSYKNVSDTEIHACPEVAEIELTPVITWEGIDPFCVVVASCDPGATYDPGTNTCQTTDEIPATPPSGGGGTPANAQHVTNNQWNNGGAQIFSPGYAMNGSGTVAATLTTPHFWVNGNFQWDAIGRNTTDSRMNAAGVWVAGETSNPLNEWIGFVRTINTPVAKTVYVAMCADNKFRFSLNGTLLVDCPGDIGGGPNFNYMNIYPVDLAPGPNFIEMWALNSDGPAGFAMEIYDQSLASLIASTSIGDLNILFTTADMFGQPFDLGDTVGWSCPAGYSLDTSGPGDPTCVQIVSDPATANNTGYKGYANRRRLANGIPDGFEEENTEVGGVGPYQPPVEDETMCPLTPSIFTKQFNLAFV